MKTELTVLKIVFTLWQFNQMWSVMNTNLSFMLSINSKITTLPSALVHDTNVYLVFM